VTPYCYRLLALVSICLKIFNIEASLSWNQWGLCNEHGEGNSTDKKSHRLDSATVNE